MSPQPKTVAELLELISQLNSKKAIIATVITHLRVCYQKSDSGPAEMRIVREDFAAVPEDHIERTLMEFENQIELIDAALEELTGQPFGGGSAPAAEAAQEQPQQPAAEEKSGAAPPTEKKGSPSGKARAQGGRPS